MFVALAVAVYRKRLSAVDTKAELSVCLVVLQAVSDSWPLALWQEHKLR
jgi:hypothetical protein